MSTERAAAKHSSSSEGKSTGTNTANLDQQQQQQSQRKDVSSKTIQDTHAQSTDQQPQQQAASIPHGSTSGETPSPRQVIAVSASKSPAAFFNLARKFLVTNEMCDLSALEGAIVSAVDAAHLLERSQLATIVR
jgi:uncharacterized protein YjdB